MIRLLAILCLSGLFFMQSIEANAQSKGVYLFSFKHFKKSTSGEILVSPFMHYARSKRLAIFYSGSSTTIYKQPVYNSLYSFLTLTYQPKLRLIEFGSGVSFTARIPVSLAFSTVDLRTKIGDRYFPPSLAQYDIDNEMYTARRTSSLGALNVEAGALVGFDIGRGATIENTSSVGLSLAAGYSFIYAPLFINSADVQSRSDYKGLLSWATMVGQIGIHTRRISLYYMGGVNPTRVHYRNKRGRRETVMTDIYHRVSIGIKLGK